MNELTNPTIKRAKCQPNNRLQVVSNFGDGDCGVSKIHMRMREILRRHDVKGAPKIKDYRQSQGF